MVKAAHRPYVPNARTNVLKLKAEFIPGLGDTVTLRAPCLPYIAPGSPLYLPCISPASPLHLPCISCRLRVHGRAARHALDPSRSTLPARPFSARPFPARPFPLNPSRSTLSRSTLAAEQRAHAPPLRAGAPAHVLDQGDVRCAEAELREVHVAPYLPAPYP